VSTLENPAILDQLRGVDATPARAVTAPIAKRSKAVKSAKKAAKKAVKKTAKKVAKAVKRAVSRKVTARRTAPRKKVAARAKRVALRKPRVNKARAKSPRAKK